VNNFLSQLGLTAQERRIVVGIFMVVFVVLNYLFVWPSFGDWGKFNKQLETMRSQIEKDNDYIKQDYATNGWKQQVAFLSQREGSSVMENPIDAQVQLQNTIRAQERKTGVYVESMHPGSVKSDEFFEEQSTAISLECQEPQLVGFLYHMGMDPAMIRVAVLNLKPDANRYRLKVSLTLTANYAKKQASLVSGAAPDKHASGAKTAAAPGPKPPAATVPKPRGAPAPMQGEAAKHMKGGPFAPGNGRQPPTGKNTPLPARPMPSPKKPPGQKASD
jgi:Tfp pilus assembly protein PilO